MPNKSIYAIGITKDWVEIREAEKPPKLRTTEFNKLVHKDVLVRGRYEIDFYEPSHWTKVPKMLKFTSSVYTGGKLVATVKSRRFAVLTKIRVHTGGMIKLTPEMTAAVMGDKR